MKAVYRADAANHIFVSSDLVADDYVLKANETFENPSGKVTPAKLQGASWVDATDEEHEAYLKQQEEKFAAMRPIPEQPDNGDRALNMLGQQFAKMQQQQTTLIQSVNALGQMVAKAAAPSTTQSANTEDKQA